MLWEVFDIDEGCAVCVSLWAFGLCFRNIMTRKMALDKVMNEVNSHILV